MNQPELSIIVISYNTAELVCRCLRSVYDHVRSASFEIIVVDNASQDDSCARISRDFPAVILLRSEQNIGFGPAVNLAARSARGEFLALLNSDAWLEEDALAVLIRRMRTEPRCGAAGSRVVFPDKTFQPSLGCFPNLVLDIQDLVLQPLTFLPAEWRKNLIDPRDYRESRKADWISGACMLLRRRAFEQLEGMDPRFFFSEEDIDFCFRLRQAGWEVYYEPAGCVVHAGGQSKAFNPKVFVHFLTGRYLFHRKHHGIFQAVLFLMIAAAALLLKILTGRAPFSILPDFIRSVRGLAR